jgi:hypothetical protein
VDVQKWIFFKYLKPFFNSSSNNFVKWRCNNAVVGDGDGKGGREDARMKSGRMEIRVVSWLLCQTHQPPFFLHEKSFRAQSTDDRFSSKKFPTRYQSSSANNLFRNQSRKLHGTSKLFVDGDITYMCDDFVVVYVITWLWVLLMNC